MQMGNGGREMAGGGVRHGEYAIVGTYWRVEGHLAVNGGRKLSDGKWRVILAGCERRVGNGGRTLEGGER